MLRRRTESHFETAFFGSLFGLATLMVGHGLAQSVIYPLMANSETVASIANGFARAWIG